MGRSRTGPGGLSWRLAGAPDAPALQALIRSAYRGVPSRQGWTSEADLIEGDRIDHEQLRAMLVGPGARMLVVSGDVRLIACCRIARAEPGMAALGTFAVAPERQGAGLGRWLIGEAQALARADFGAETVEIEVLDAQAALLAWYERLGFVATGQSRPFPVDARHARPLRDGLRFVTMRRTIPHSG